MKKSYKKSKGITLIAVVITIIVLLILTGVGLVYISGDTGILDKTIFARETHKKQKIRESLNLELNNILTGQISEHKPTSKKASSDEFKKLNYEVEEEGEGDDLICYIFEQGYIYEIEEKEDGYQEVVFVGEATKRKPRIMDLKLSIEDSKLKISTKTNRAKEYKYEIILDGNKLEKIETKDTSEYVDYYVDLKELDEENNNSVFGTLKVKVTAYNENNKGLFNYDESDTKYNKERDINVSKITFDTNDGQFENGEKTFIAFLETGKGFNTINLADLTNPIRSHYTFAGWYIPGDPVEKELEIEETTTDKLPVDLIINAHWTDVSHDYSIEVSKVEPTCETEGSKEMHCSIEGCTDPIQIITIAALGHSYTQESTENQYKITDATCQAEATYYKSCERCGLASTTETFASGNKAAHNYTSTSSTAYKATDATCQAAATYYKTCVWCGAKGTETFASGNKASHSYTSTSSTAYKATDATCQAAATYYKTCVWCGAKGTETFASGNKASHSYTSTSTDSSHRKSTATCQAAAVYYKSCKWCGANGTATFSSGSVAAHSYTSTSSTAYKATDATCQAAATYFKTCVWCGAKGTSTFSSGSKASHSYTSKSSTSTYLKSSGTCQTAAVYYYKCKWCTAKGSSTYTGSKADHSYTAGRCVKCAESTGICKWCKRCKAYGHTSGNYTY